MTKTPSGRRLGPLNRVLLVIATYLGASGVAMLVADAWGLAQRGGVERAIADRMVFNGAKVIAGCCVLLWLRGRRHRNGCEKPFHWHGGWFAFTLLMMLASVLLAVVSAAST